MSFFDRVDAFGIEGEMIFDERDRRVRRLIGPHGIHRAMPAKWNAEVGTVALIGTVGGVVRALEQRHVYVLARDVLNRRIARLAQNESVPRIGHDTARDR